MKISLLNLKKFFIIVTVFFSSAAYCESFSIDDEFQARKTLEFYAKKHGMKTNLKRKDGALILRFWDKGFFVNDWKLTKTGTQLIKRISGDLCLSADDCDVTIESHHVDNNSRLALVMSQYKMLSVSIQLLRSKISPKFLVQKSLGDIEPLIVRDKSDLFGDYNSREMNTRIEISFASRKKTY